MLRGIYPELATASPDIGNQGLIKAGSTAGALVRTGLSRELLPRATALFSRIIDKVQPDPHATNALANAAWGIWEVANREDAKSPELAKTLDAGVKLVTHHEVANSEYWQEQHRNRNDPTVNSGNQLGRLVGNASQIFATVSQIKEADINTRRGAIDNLSILAGHRYAQKDAVNHAYDGLKAAAEWETDPKRLEGISHTLTSICGRGISGTPTRLINQTCLGIQQKLQKVHSRPGSPRAGGMGAR